jgi:AcrR family transcriptional regulator
MFVMPEKTTADKPDLPVPSWKPTRRPPTPRPQLTRELIVETALRLLDADGLDGVSMRRVADELGTGPASLYAHVANKEELLDLLHDRVLADIELPEPDPARWREQLREVGLRLYRAYGEHGDIAVVSLANVPTGPNALRLSEWMLALTMAGGVPPRVAAMTLDRLSLYIGADAYEGSLFRKRQLASGLTKEQFFDHFAGGLRNFFANLPADRFPLLVEHVDKFVDGSGDERFEFGLDMIIRSLASHAEETGVNTPDAR